MTLSESVKEARRIALTASKALSDKIKNDNKIASINALNDAKMAIDAIKLKIYDEAFKLEQEQHKILQDKVRQELEVERVLTGLKHDIGCSCKYTLDKLGRIIHHADTIVDDDTDDHLEQQLKQIRIDKYINMRTLFMNLLNNNNSLDLKNISDINNNGTSP